MIAVVALMAAALASPLAARPADTGPGICPYEEVSDLDVILGAGPGQGLVLAIDAALERAFILGLGGCDDFPLQDGGAAADMDGPRGIVAGPGGRIYVADTGNDRILVFDDVAGLDSSDPLDLLDIFSQPSTGLNLNAPRGLGASDAGRLYIADTGAARVQVVDSIGQLQDTLGGPDDGDDQNGVDGEFLEPVDVAICASDAQGDMAGRVFVLDRARPTVQVFDSDGAFEFRFGYGGDERGRFSLPSGIAVDDTCNVYVADHGNARVQMFDGNGAFLEVLGTVSTVAAVAVDPRVTQGGVHAASDGEDVITTFDYISYDTDFDGNSDNDGDGLPDIWEEQGIDIGMDGTIDYVLPDADMNRKNLYIEIDFAADQEIPEATEDPEAEDSVDIVVNAFANAPVSNPDGSTGVDLHVERGEPGDFIAELVGFGVEPSILNAFPDDLSLFDNIKREMFGTPVERAAGAEVIEAKGLAFRYAVMVESICPIGMVAEDGVPVCCTTQIDVQDGMLVCLEEAEGEAPDPPAGRAEYPGDDMVFSNRGEAGSDAGFGMGGEGGDLPGPADFVADARQIAGLFMHELGHNLGLHHGGDRDINCKPNYLSVMNYAMMTGIRTADPAYPYDARIDFSNEVLDTLREEEGLDETIGIALPSRGPDGTFTDRTLWGNNETAMTERGDLPIDWDLDGDGATNTSAVVDINNPGIMGCDGDGVVLTGWNDWATIVYSSRRGDGFGRGAPAVVPENEPTIADLVALDDLYESLEGLRYTWAAKFLCVPLVGPEATALSPGRYQTTINVLNPGRDEARLRKGITIARSELDPRGPVTPFEEDALGPREALSLDCTSLATRFVEPQAVGDGFVQLQSDVLLDVVAVYTSRDGLEVEPVPASDRMDPQDEVPGDDTPSDDTPPGDQPPDDGERPDLPDLAVDLPERTREVCSETGSVCELFAQVAVSNVGTADAAQDFEVTVTLDSGQSATFTVAGLSVGAVVAQVVQFPAGPPCYDPTCVTSAIVDATGAIQETDENNNTASREDG